MWQLGLHILQSKQSGEFRPVLEVESDVLANAFDVDYVVVSHQINLVIRFDGYVVVALRYLVNAFDRAFRCSPLITHTMQLTQ